MSSSKRVSDEPTDITEVVSLLVALFDDESSVLTQMEYVIESILNPLEASCCRSTPGLRQATTTAPPGTPTPTLSSSSPGKKVRGGKHDTTPAPCVSPPLSSPLSSSLLSHPSAGPGITYSFFWKLFANYAALYQSMRQIHRLHETLSYSLAKGASLTRFLSFGNSGEEMSLHLPTTAEFSRRGSLPSAVHSRTASLVSSSKAQLTATEAPKTHHRRSLSSRIRQFSFSRKKKQNETSVNHNSMSNIQSKPDPVPTPTSPTMHRYARSAESLSPTSSFAASPLRATAPTRSGTPCDLVVDFFSSAEMQHFMLEYFMYVDHYVRLIAPLVMDLQVLWGRLTDVEGSAKQGRWVPNPVALGSCSPSEVEGVQAFFTFLYELWGPTGCEPGAGRVGGASLPEGRNPPKGCHSFQALLVLLGVPLSTLWRFVYYAQCICMTGALGPLNDDEPNLKTAFLTPAIARLEEVLSLVVDHLCHRDVEMVNRLLTPPPAQPRRNLMREAFALTDVGRLSSGFASDAESSLFPAWNNVSTEATRVLLRYGRVLFTAPRFKTGSRVLFLFNDSLVVVKEKQEGYFKVLLFHLLYPEQQQQQQAGKSGSEPQSNARFRQQGSTPPTVTTPSAAAAAGLSGGASSVNCPAPKPEFTIVSDGSPVFTAGTDTIEEQEEWVAVIRKAIRDQPYLQKQRQAARSTGKPIYNAAMKLSLLPPTSRLARDRAADLKLQQSISEARYQADESDAKLGELAETLRGRRADSSQQLQMPSTPTVTASTTSRLGGSAFRQSPQQYAVIPSAFRRTGSSRMLDESISVVADVTPPEPEEKGDESSDSRSTSSSSSSSSSSTSPPPSDSPPPVPLRSTLERPEDAQEISFSLSASLNHEQPEVVDHSSVNVVI